MSICLGLTILDRMRMGRQCFSLYSYFFLRARQSGCSRFLTFQAHLFGHSRLDDCNLRHVSIAIDLPDALNVRLFDFIPWMTKRQWSCAGAGCGRAHRRL